MTEEFDLSSKIEGIFKESKGCLYHKQVKKDVKEFIRLLKKELVCDFCKKHPSYNGMCSQCFNAGAKIDKLLGEELSK